MKNTVVSPRDSNRVKFDIMPEEYRSQKASHAEKNSHTRQTSGLSAELKQKVIDAGNVNEKSYPKT